MSNLPESQPSGKNLSHWYYYQPQPKERVTKIHNDVASLKKKRTQRVPYTIRDDTVLPSALNLVAQSHQSGNHKTRNNRIESSVIRKKLEEIDELRAKILLLQQSFCDEKVKPKVLKTKSNSCFQCVKCKKKSEPEIIVKFPPNSRMKFDQCSTEALVFASQETLVKYGKTKEVYHEDIKNPENKRNKHSRKRRVIHNAIFIPESLSSSSDQIKQLTQKINDQHQEIKDIKAKLEECISLLKHKQSSNYEKQSCGLEVNKNSMLFDDFSCMNCHTSSFETEDELFNDLLKSSEIVGFKPPNPFVYPCVCEPKGACLQSRKKGLQVREKPLNKVSKNARFPDNDTEEIDNELKLTVRRGKFKRRTKQVEASEPVTTNINVRKTDDSKVGNDVVDECFLRGDELVMTVSALGPHNIPQDKKNLGKSFLKRRKKCSATYNLSLLNCLSKPDGKSMKFSFKGRKPDVDTLFYNSPSNDKLIDESGDKRSVTKKFCTCNKMKSSGKPCPRHRRKGILRFLLCLCYPCCVN